MRAPIPLPRNARPGGYPATGFDWKKLAGVAGDPLSDLGYGLATGGFENMFGAATQRGAQQQPYRDQQDALRKSETEQAATRNATVEWLKSKARSDPRYAELVAGVEAGAMDVGQAWQAGLAIGAEKPPGPIKASAGDVFLDPVTYQPISSVPDPAAAADAAKDAFGFEKDLFAQYGSSDPVKTYSAVRDGYERVRASAQQQTGAGDMGLIYGYMRMLDPGSVVRESEFAMAAQAGDFGEQVKGLVSQILNGQRLPESQRQEFLANADALYAESAKNLGDINSQFEQRAGGYNVDPTRFIRQPEQYPTLGKPMAGRTTTGINFTFTPGN